MEERCPTCGSEDVVSTGPLTIDGEGAVLTVVSGKQCVLCGNLQVTIPQILLVKMYPPNVRHITRARRVRLQNRRNRRRHQQALVPLLH